MQTALSHVLCVLAFFATQPCHAFRKKHNIGGRGNLTTESMAPTYCGWAIRPTGDDIDCRSVMTEPSNTYIGACRLSECSSLRACKAKCDACSSCQAVKIKDGGGGGIRCHMKGSVAASGITGTNPGTATSWHYTVNSRSPLCQASGPVPAPARRRRSASAPTPAPTRRRRSAPAPTPPGRKPGPNDGFKHSEWNHYYLANNPLNIKSAIKRSNNYFILIGDWGASGSGVRGRTGCQEMVGKMLQDYVKRQKAAGKTLLFFGSLGDNFYGQVGSGGQKFASAWRDMYGRDLTSNYAWLSVLGNHDYGRNDPLLGQPSSSYKVHGQNYGGLQLNADKNNGKRPSYTNMYWLPDYNYHYSIPSVGLEVISTDTNSAAPIGKNPGRALLRFRGKVSKATNVLLINHYSHRNLIREYRKGGGKAKVMLAFGHSHYRNITDETIDGMPATTILSGHGGGRPSKGQKYGFVVVHLEEGTRWRTEPRELSCNLQGRREWRDDDEEEIGEAQLEDEEATRRKFGSADDPQESGEEACDELDNAEEFMSSSELASAEEDVDFAVASSAPKDILSKVLLLGNARKATPTVLAQSKHVIFYFGRNACGRTRSFTPELAKAYKASSKAGKETIVVYVSLDENQEEFDEIFAKMPWHAVPWNFKTTVTRLRRIMIKESVGLPYMYVMNDQGRMITNDRNLYKRFF